VASALNSIRGQPLEVELIADLKKIKADAEKLKADAEKAKADAEQQKEALAKAQVFTRTLEGALSFPDPQSRAKSRRD
jgi:hypothetical protein